MQEAQPEFKKPSSKHQPKGLVVLYDDQDIIVVNKSSGLLTMGTENEKEKTAYYLLNDYVKKGNSRSRNRVFIVHRLDRDTSGTIVFAKNEDAKQFLQGYWSDFSKTYYAVVHGTFEKKHGIIESYLAENRANKVYSVKNAIDGKYSKTEYTVLKESSKYSLLEIKLHTGTKNQIRVHFSENNHPVVGDKAYGIYEKGVLRLALHAATLEIAHPYTRKMMRFETQMPAYFNTLMGEPEIHTQKPIISSAGQTELPHDKKPVVKRKK